MLPAVDAKDPCARTERATRAVSGARSREQEEEVQEYFELAVKHGQKQFDLSMLFVTSSFIK